MNLIKIFSFLKKKIIPAEYFSQWKRKKQKTIFTVSTWLDFYYYLLQFSLFFLLLFWILFCEIFCIYDDYLDRFILYNEKQSLKLGWKKTKHWNIFNIQRPRYLRSIFIKLISINDKTFFWLFFKYKTKLSFFVYFH